jgi:hypothetical protein
LHTLATKTTTRSFTDSRVPRDEEYGLIRVEDIGETWTDTALWTDSIPVGD